MKNLYINNFCPVCGYDLGFPAWDGESPSDEICNCCGIQFGYGDIGPGGLEGRKKIYDDFRQYWIEQEKMAWDRGREDPPEGWDPKEQLKNIGVELG